MIKYNGNVKAFSFPNGLVLVKNSLPLFLFKVWLLQMEHGRLTEMR